MCNNTIQDIYVNEKIVLKGRWKCFPINSRLSLYCSSKVCTLAKGKQLRQCCKKVASFVSVFLERLFYVFLGRIAALTSWEDFCRLLNCPKRSFSKFKRHPKKTKNCNFFLSVAHWNFDKMDYQQYQQYQTMGYNSYHYQYPTPNHLKVRSF